MARRRQKATDVLRERRPVDGITFDEAFPDIEALRIEVRECDASDSPPEFIYARPIVYSGKRFVVDCSAKMCYGGGVKFLDELYEMVRERKVSTTITRTCEGYSGSPQGRKNYGPCHHAFQVTIEIQYRA